MTCALINKAIGLLSVLLLLNVGASLVSGGTVKVQGSCDGMLCTIIGRNYACSELSGYTCCRGPRRGQWKLLELTDGSPELKCCHGSGRIYNQSSELCINETIIVKNSTEILECGLSKLYNETNQKCCKKNETFGNVYPKTGICCNERNLDEPEMECCEGTAYNRSLQTCCPNADNYYRLYNIPNGSCCTDMPYDPATQLCIPGVRVENKSREQRLRCDSLDGKNYNYYNYETNICCQGKIYSRTNYICFKHMIPVPKRNESDNQVCRVRNDQGKFQYSTYYNGTESRKACIHGKIISLSEGREQCSDEIYDTTTDLCCAGLNVVRNGRTLGLECCDRGFYAYDPTTATCCLRNIDSSISKRNGGECCGETAFDSNTHRCNEREKIEALDQADQDQDLFLNTSSSFSERCSYTSDDIRNLRDNLERGGYYVYIGTAESKKVKNSRRESYIKWRLKNVTQVIPRKSGKKGQKVALTSVGSITLISRENQCSDELNRGNRYIIFAEKPSKGKGNRRRFQLKMKNSNNVRNGNDVIIPLSDATRLGEWFQIIFSIPDQ